LGDDGGGEVGAGAVEVSQGVLVLDEQLGDLSVEVGDAAVEVGDVSGELADAACRGASCSRLSLFSSRWRSQRITPASATGSCWVQSERSRWIA
jgi:hypothetical protein